MGDYLTQVVLIAYLLLIEYNIYRNFDKLYRSLFWILDDRKEPYGKWQFVAFFCLGMLLSLSLFMEMAGVITNGENYFTYIVVLAAIVVMLYTLIDCVASFKRFGPVFKRFTFVLFLCVFGAVGGFFVMLLGISAVIILAALLFVAVILKSVFNRKPRYVLDDGTVLEKKSGLFGDEHYYDTETNDPYSRLEDRFRKQ